jgi:hypothetical protein
LVRQKQMQFKRLQTQQSDCLMKRKGPFRRAFF